MTRPFLFLSANTPWVYALGQALSDHTTVTTVRFYDWANYWRLRPPWPETTSRVRRCTLCLPPGYAGRLEPVFRTYVRSVIASERSRLRLSTGAEPIVVCPYPYLAPWLRAVPDDDLVYYNLDDYALYDPARAAWTAQLEDEIIGRARLSLCLSVHQVEALRARHPQVAQRIVHFPLGVVEDFLNPEPSLPPIPRTVGYVGNLTNRVDWPLIERVATLTPEATFHFVGKLDDTSSGPKVDGWQTARARVLALANVVYEGAVPQTQVREHYWRYAVNWMPYAMDHPFNIASCPTKIMDELASGRPVVSTAIPECQLYPEWIDIATDADEAIRLVSFRLSDSEGEARRQRSREQVEYVRKTHMWRERAARLLELIG